MSREITYSLSFPGKLLAATWTSYGKRFDCKKNVDSLRIMHSRSSSIDTVAFDGRPFVRPPPPLASLSRDDLLVEIHLLRRQLEERQNAPTEVLMQRLQEAESEAQRYRLMARDVALAARDTIGDLEARLFAARSSRDVRPPVGPNPSLLPPEEEEAIRLSRQRTTVPLQNAFPYIRDARAQDEANAAALLLDAALRGLSDMPRDTFAPALGQAVWGAFRDIEHILHAPPTRASHEQLLEAPDRVLEQLRRLSEMSNEDSRLFRYVAEASDALLRLRLAMGQ